jgi:hypothetical protein
MNRWEGNIRIDLRGIKWEGAYWMYLALDRNQWRDLVNKVTDIRVP